MVCSRRSTLLRTHLLPTVVPPYKELAECDITPYSAHCWRAQIEHIPDESVFKQFCEDYQKKRIISFAFIIIGLSIRCLKILCQQCEGSHYSHAQLMLREQLSVRLGVKHEI